MIALVGVPIMMAEILMGRRTQLSPVGAFKTLAAGRPGGAAWQRRGLPGRPGRLHHPLLLQRGRRLDHPLHLAGPDRPAGRTGRRSRRPCSAYFGNEFLASGTAPDLLPRPVHGPDHGAVYFGVKGGIERVAKILMPLLFLILLILVIYSTTTTGLRRSHDASSSGPISPP